MVIRNTKFIYPALLFILIACTGLSPKTGDSENATLEGKELWKELTQNATSATRVLPDSGLLGKALTGYEKLKASGKIHKEILTVIDFRMSSNKKRMWVIDVKNKSVLFHSLVAHGKKSGDEYVKSFSNEPFSNQSSLGFYITRGTYSGKHGLSLKLDGMEKGFNDNAQKRAIVMHGAKYVSNSFIRQYGRLGRSLGCPSVPEELSGDIIECVKGNSCLFIYYPDKEYEKNSTILN